MAKRRSTPGTGWRKGRDGKMRPYARVTWVEDGKVRSKEVRARTITHARDLRAQMLQELKGYGPELLTADRLTFGELAEQYKQEKLVEPVYVGDTKIGGQRAWRNQRGFLKPLIDYFGSRRLNSITYEDLVAYRKKRFETPTRRGEQRSVSNVNRELSLLRAIFNYARRSNLIIRSPFEMGAGLISIADETKRERILTRDEERRLLEACTGARAHLYYIVLMALATGMRKGEILQLTWPDVDFDQRVITVKAEITKTRRERVIGMTAKLKTTLEHWQMIQQESELVFAGIKDVKRSFTTACRKAGIENFRFHDLRHTATTRMVQAGVLPAEVMKQTGHTQWTTFNRYLNVDRDSARRIAEILDKADSISEPNSEPGSEMIH